MIDTLDGEVGAKEVIEDFEKKKIVTSEKPIKAVIITHFHADHSNGIGYIRRQYPDAMVNLCSFSIISFVRKIIIRNSKLKINVA